MDILNWLRIKKQNLIRTTLDSPKDLVVLGADVSFQKRGDKYQSYAMPATDLVNSATIASTAHYELDITAGQTVTVNTPRGIIDVLGMGTSAGNTPAPSYSSSLLISINNLDLDLTPANKDNIYVQYSVYYNRGLSGTDNAIPYVLSVGTISGLEFSVYNANPAVAGATNWDGEFYIYYELYTI